MAWGLCVAHASFSFEWQVQKAIWTLLGSGRKARRLSPFSFNVWERAFAKKVDLQLGAVAAEENARAVAKTHELLAASRALRCLRAARLR